MPPVTVPSRKVRKLIWLLYILLIGGVLGLSFWQSSRPLLIVKNENTRRIITLRVAFQGKSAASSGTLVYENVGHLRTRALVYGSDWGVQGSERMVRVVGRFSDGQPISGQGSFEAGSSAAFERLLLTVHVDGSVSFSTPV